MKTTRLTEIQTLYDYNTWANRRILDASAVITDEQFARNLGNSFPSIQDTLVHIHFAEWLWLARWNGSSPSTLPVEWVITSLKDLRSRWNETEKQLNDFIASLSEEKLDKGISYMNTSGQSFTNPLWHLLRHVVNHSTYHRGQVVTMLRQLDAAAVSTDFVLYFREKESKTDHA